MTDESELVETSQNGDSVFTKVVWVGEERGDSPAYSSVVLGASGVFA